ncbi:MAG: S8 family serine peptidase [Thermofilaceae archaeon]
MPRYLVEFEPGRRDEVYRGLKALGITPLRLVINRYWLVDVPGELVPRIEALPGVVRVVEEIEYSVTALPVDRKLAVFLRMGGPLNPLAMVWAARFRKDRWPTSESRRILEADVADQMGVTGKGVKVAVLDTGFDVTPQRTWVDYVDSTLEGDPVPLDVNGHGSHVLTTIAGGRIPTPWGYLEGVAKGVQIASIKCLGYGVGTARTSDVMEAVAAAYHWGAKIVNMSLGANVRPGREHNPDECPLCSLITVLSRRGVIFVVAAGNSGPGHASCPGASPGAITVAAVRRDLSVAGFSSRDHPVYERYMKPDVAAPGVDIGSSTTGLIDAMEWVDGPRVAFISGTSMATPHIAGLVALWVEYARSRGVELDRDTVMDIVRSYSGGWRSDTGYGVPRFSWIVDYLR